ncbi:uncharacterized protein LOC121990945 [Zingiber officinale]|uniref:uncharacterized protein LOC121990945 n=1 Tax=Zingiber officinale TaxID=94328 RepID=UPI001C4B78E1|nr:uncharacterized protein LOC121990945 [Zingiber officinale]
MSTLLKRIYRGSRGSSRGKDPGRDKGKEKAISKGKGKQSACDEDEQKDGVHHSLTEELTSICKMDIEGALIVLASLCHLPSKEELCRMMVEADSDEDDFISLEESMEINAPSVSTDERCPRLSFTRLTTVLFHCENDWCHPTAGDAPLSTQENQRQCCSFVVPQ